MVTLGWGCTRILRSQQENEDTSIGSEIFALERSTNEHCLQSVDASCLLNAYTKHAFPFRPDSYNTIISLPFQRGCTPHRGKEIIFIYPGFFFCGNYYHKKRLRWNFVGITWIWTPISFCITIICNFSFHNCKQSLEVVRQITR